MGFLTAGSTFSSAIQSLISIINLLVGVLSALAIVVFFWGLVRYIKDSGDAHDHAEGRERILWSLIALFILFSLWGILSLMSIALFGTSTLNGGTDTSGQPLNIAPSFNGSSGSISQGTTGGTSDGLGGLH
jgi:Type IV secretion system pilin